MRTVRCAVLTALLPAAALPAAASESWPGWRGPEVAHAGALPAEGFGLELRWKVPLGPAYSGIAPVGGRAVTMFADGESDLLAALEIDSGREAWRFRLGEMYAGHDGSGDGALSSPVIDDGLVYALGPRGLLVAVRLADGSPVWSKDLVTALGARAPFYGFTTTPLVEGEVLVVLAGGDAGRSMVGLDKRTGEVRWSHGDETITHQSPVPMTLAGRRQVVLATDAALYGLVAKTGEVLWRAEHPADHEAGKVMPVALGGDRLLVDYWNGAVAFRLRTDGEGHALEELYRTRELRESYTPPVLHDGHLYGTSGSFLTCIDAATGERVWKSRPPGGRGVTLVDGRLVILGPKGVVVIAEATPDGYRERARLEALDRTGLTRPSFAGGRVFVRNGEEMASLSIREAAPARPEVHARAAAPATRFGEWVRRVEAAQDKGALIAAFLEEQESFPVVEDDRFVHFVYRGEVEDIAITGSMIDSYTEEAMDRIDGTDFYYKTYPIEPGSRWDYRFQVNFDDWVLDPRNDRVTPYLWDEIGYSELVTAGYRLPDFLGEPGGPRGKLESFTLESAELGNSREVTVYLPAGYETSGRRYPLLVVVDGRNWIDKGLLPVALDNLIGSRAAPLVSAFVGRPEEDWWQEEGGSRSAEFVRMLTGELVPRVEEKYRTLAEPASRAVLGVTGGGTVAALAALGHPEVFGMAAVQSIDLEEPEPLMHLLAEAEPRGQRLYVDWNRYAQRNEELGFDFLEFGRRFAAELQARGYRYEGGEVLDAWGWGGWRSRVDRILATLFPLEREAASASGGPGRPR